MDTFNPVTHVIFDMDGLLIDSERLYTVAIQKVASEFGKEYTFELKSKCMGTKAEIGAQMIIDALQLPLTVREYFEKIEKLYEQLFPNCKILPDSVGQYQKAHCQALSTFNVSISWENLMSLMGSTSKETAEGICALYHLPITAAEYQASVSSAYPEFLPHCSLITEYTVPGVDKLVRHLHSHKIPIAIASGGSEPFYKMKTQNLQEFFKLFSHVVLASSDPEVMHGKPAPDVFLVCANRFPDSPSPNKCLVFEDAPLGVKSGLAAGMQVVMVPDPRLEESKRKEANLVLNSIEDFIPETFGLPAYNS